MRGPTRQADYVDGQTSEIVFRWADRDLSPAPGVGPVSL